VNHQTLTPPGSDERALDELEAEFLRCASVWPSTLEIDAAEMLAPAIGSVDQPACAGSYLRSRYGGCCH
jgi:hypothetical protein